MTIHRLEGRSTLTEAYTHFGQKYGSFSLWNESSGVSPPRRLYFNLTVSKRGTTLTQKHGEIRIVSPLGGKNGVRDIETQLSQSSEVNAYAWGPPGVVV